MTRCSDQHHEALKRDASAWRALPFIGTQPTYDPDHPDERLELRNCPVCSSSLAIRITPAVLP
jgi:hypothetical protein